MGLAVKLLNKFEYTDVTGTLLFTENERGYIKLWTELPSLFAQYSKVFIYGGQLQNTGFAETDPYNDYAQGYNIIQTGETQSIVIQCNTTITSIWDNTISPYIDEAYIASTIFSFGDFNNGTFNGGLFGDYRFVSSTLLDEAREARFNYKNGVAQWNTGMMLGGDFLADWTRKDSTQTAKLNTNRTAIENDNSRASIDPFFINKQGPGYTIWHSGKAGWVGNFTSTYTFSGQTLILQKIWELEKAVNRPLEIIVSGTTRNDILFQITGIIESSSNTILTIEAEDGLYFDETGTALFMAGIRSTWQNGEWRSGEARSLNWKAGIWRGGNWKAGTWENGLATNDWTRSIWESGVWENGEARGLIWESGVWKTGNWVGLSQVFKSTITGNQATIANNTREQILQGDTIFISSIRNTQNTEWSRQYLDTYAQNTPLNGGEFSAITVTNNNIIFDNLTFDPFNSSRSFTSTSNFKSGTWLGGVWTNGARTVDSWTATIDTGNLASSHTLTIIQNSDLSGVSSTQIQWSGTTTLAVGDWIVVNDQIRQVVALNGDILQYESPAIPNPTILKKRIEINRFKLNIPNPIGLKVRNKIAIGGIAIKDLAGIITDPAIFTIAGITGNTVETLIEPQWSGITNLEGLTIIVSKAIWSNGEWKTGIWQGGVWYNGDWNTNTSESAIWKSGYWKDGEWITGDLNSGQIETGTFKGGRITNFFSEDAASISGNTVWYNATLEGGLFNRGLWLSGDITANGAIKIAGIESIIVESDNIGYVNATDEYPADIYLANASQNTAPGLVYIDSTGKIKLTGPSYYQTGYKVYPGNLGVRDTVYDERLLTITSHNTDRSELYFTPITTGITSTYVWTKNPTWASYIDTNGLFITDKGMNRITNVFHDFGDPNASINLIGSVLGESGFTINDLENARFNNIISTSVWRRRLYLIDYNGIWNMNANDGNVDSTVYTGTTNLWTNDNSILQSWANNNDLYFISDKQHGGLLNYNRLSNTLTGFTLNLNYNLTGLGGDYDLGGVVENTYILANVSGQTWSNFISYNSVFTTELVNINTGKQLGNIGVKGTTPSDTQIVAITEDKAIVGLTTTGQTHNGWVTKRFEYPVTSVYGDGTTITVLAGPNIYLLDQTILDQMVPTVSQYYANELRTISVQGDYTWFSNDDQVLYKLSGSTLELANNLWRKEGSFTDINLSRLNITDIMPGRLNSPNTSWMSLDEPKLYKLTNTISSGYTCDLVSISNIMSVETLFNNIPDYVMVAGKANTISIYNNSVKLFNVTGNTFLTGQTYFGEDNPIFLWNEIVGTSIMPRAFTPIFNTGTAIHWHYLEWPTGVQTTSNATLKLLKSTDTGQSNINPIRTTITGGFVYVDWSDHTKYMYYTLTGDDKLSKIYRSNLGNATDKVLIPTEPTQEWTNITDNYADYDVIDINYKWRSEPIINWTITESGTTIVVANTLDLDLVETQDVYFAPSSTTKVFTKVSEITGTTIFVEVEKPYTVGTGGFIYWRRIVVSDSDSRIVELNPISGNVLKITSIDKEITPPEITPYYRLGYNEDSSLPYLSARILWGAEWNSGIFNPNGNLHSAFINNSNFNNGTVEGGTWQVARLLDTTTINDGYFNAGTFQANWNRGVMLGGTITNSLINRYIGYADNEDLFISGNLNSNEQNQIVSVSADTTTGIWTAKIKTLLLDNEWTEGRSNIREGDLFATSSLFIRRRFPINLVNNSKSVSIARTDNFNIIDDTYVGTYGLNLASWGPQLASSTTISSQNLILNFENELFESYSGNTINKYRSSNILIPGNNDPYVFGGLKINDVEYILNLYSTDIPDIINIDSITGMTIFYNEVCKKLNYINAGNYTWSSQYLSGSTFNIIAYDYTNSTSMDIIYIEVPDINNPIETLTVISFIPFIVQTTPLFASDNFTNTGNYTVSTPWLSDTDLIKATGVSYNETDNYTLVQFKMAIPLEDWSLNKVLMPDMTWTKSGNTFIIEPGPESQLWIGAVYSGSKAAQSNNATITSLITRDVNINTTNINDSYIIYGNINNSTINTSYINGDVTNSTINSARISGQDGLSHNLNNSISNSNLNSNFKIKAINRIGVKDGKLKFRVDTDESISTFFNPGDKFIIKGLTIPQLGGAISRSYTVLNTGYDWVETYLPKDLIPDFTTPFVVDGTEFVQAVLAKISIDGSNLINSNTINTIMSKGSYLHSNKNNNLIGFRDGYWYSDAEFMGIQAETSSIVVNDEWSRLEPTQFGTTSFTFNWGDQLLVMDDDNLYYTYFTEGDVWFKGSVSGIVRIEQLRSVSGVSYMQTAIDIPWSTGNTLATYPRTSKFKDGKLMFTDWNGGLFENGLFEPYLDESNNINYQLSDIYINSINQIIQNNNR